MNPSASTPQTETSAPHHPVVAGNTEVTAPANRVYFPALDGLRAVAFLLVFLHHYLHFLYGWVGVDIFFVLSGFLITGILVDTADTPHRARNFYIRRTLRIFPLYYVVLLGVLLVTPLLHWQWTWQWLAWPLYLGNFLRFLYPHASLQFVAPFSDAFLVGRFHSNPCTIMLGHFWSLCVEEQFYLVWPWIVFACRSRRKLIAICAASIILVPCARALAAHYLPATLVQGEVTAHATPFRFDTLMYGALLALLYRSSYRQAMFRWASWVLPVIPILAAWVLFQRLHNGTYQYPAGLATWVLCLVALLSSAVLLNTLVPGSVCYRLFHLRWLRALGVISYGAYVFHDIPHDAYFRIARRLPFNIPDTTAVIGLIGTIILATLSYRFLESPFLRLKDRFTRSA